MVSNKRGLACLLILLLVSPALSGVIGVSSGSYGLSSSGYSYGGYKQLTNYNDDGWRTAYKAISSEHPEVSHLTPIVNYQSNQNGKNYDANYYDGHRNAFINVQVQIGQNNKCLLNKFSVQTPASVSTASNSGSSSSSSTSSPSSTYGSSYGSSPSSSNSGSSSSNSGYSVPSSGYSSAGSSSVDQTIATNTPSAPSSTTDQTISVTSSPVDTSVPVPIPADTTSTTAVDTSIPYNTSVPLIAPPPITDTSSTTTASTTSTSSGSSTSTGSSGTVNVPLISFHLEIAFRSYPQLRRSYRLNDWRGYNTVKHSESKGTKTSSVVFGGFIFTFLPITTSSTSTISTPSSSWSSPSSSSSSSSSPSSSWSSTNPTKSVNAQTYTAANGSTACVLN